MPSCQPAAREEGYDPIPWHQQQEELAVGSGGGAGLAGVMGRLLQGGQGVSREEGGYGWCLGR